MYSTTKAVVEDPQGRQYPVKLSPTDTVLDLKKLIAQQIGNPNIANLRLFFGAEELANASAFSSFKIREGDKLFLRYGSTASQEPTPYERAQQILLHFDSRPEALAERRVIDPELVELIELRDLEKMTDLIIRRVILAYKLAEKKEAKKMEMSLNLKKQILASSMPMIRLKINSFDFFALVDSGCEYTMMKESLMDKCGLRSLMRPSDLAATGLKEVAFLGEIPRLEILIMTGHSTHPVVKIVSSVAVLPDEEKSAQTEMLFGNDIMLSCKVHNL